MSDVSPQWLSDMALRAALTSRCQRAYHHEVKNGLQGIYGATDALIRATRPERLSSVPVEQVVQFARQAIANHERRLGEVIDSITGDPGAPQVIDVAQLVRDLAQFLGTDAARRSVRFQCDFLASARTFASRSRLHLLVLALLVDAIDHLAGGGEVRIRLEHIGTALQLTIAHDMTAWPTGDDSDAALHHLIRNEAVRIADELGAELERPDAKAENICRLRLPAAPPALPLE